MAKKNEMSKFMAEAAKEAARKKLRKEMAKQEKEQSDAPAEEVRAKELPLSPNAGKTTNLVFFRQYNTYQALLEIYPRESIDVSGCFSKTILYIMKWFRKRLGENAYEEYPEVLFLKNDYPEPEAYPDFKIAQVKDINGLDFIELETAYLPEKNAWLLCLTEPDNGNDKQDIHGRTFTTEIMVYRLEKSVLLGIRLSCREPRSNTEDANVYRPAFVNAMFKDPDFRITEYGLPVEYAFDYKPVFVNGKAGDDCNRLYKELIDSEFRQMPILFIPGSFYEKNETEVNEKSASLLGFCHIVVWQSSCRKLFASAMNNTEFAEVAEEGQLILYRTNYMQEYEPVYYEAEEEDVLNVIKNWVKKEPLRKLCDYKGFDFKPSWWEVSRRENAADSEDVAKVRKEFEAEIEKLKRANNELRRDSDSLQRKKDELIRENEDLDKLLREDAVEISAKNKDIEFWKGEYNSAKKARQSLEAEKMMMDIQIRSLRNLKNIYKPLLDFPPFEREKKDEILNWIRKYYSDVLVIHPNGEKSFFDDKRNIDWHRFCMMIHYLAGYTRYRNEGGKAIDSYAAREYDPEDAAYSAEPVSSGQGAIDTHKDKYTITITGKDGKKEDVLMDMHIKTGKGKGDNMLRIYFYYSPEMKKSVIGYMPGHLPTRKDGH